MNSMDPRTLSMDPWFMYKKFAKIQLFQICEKVEYLFDYFHFCQFFVAYFQFLTIFGRLFLETAIAYLSVFVIRLFVALPFKWWNIKSSNCKF